MWNQKKKGSERGVYCSTHVETYTIEAFRNSFIHVIEMKERKKKRGKLNVNRELVWSLQHSSPFIRFSSLHHSQMSAHFGFLVLRYFFANACTFFLFIRFRNLNEEPTNFRCINLMHRGITWANEPTSQREQYKWKTLFSVWLAILFDNFHFYWFEQHNMAAVCCLFQHMFHHCSLEFEWILMLAPFHSRYEWRKKNA